MKSLLRFAISFQVSGLKAFTGKVKIQREKFTREVFKKIFSISVTRRIYARLWRLHCSFIVLYEKMKNIDMNENNTKE